MSRRANRLLWIHAAWEGIGVVDAGFAITVRRNPSSFSRSGPSTIKNSTPNSWVVAHRTRPISILMGMLPSEEARRSVTSMLSDTGVSLWTAQPPRDKLKRVPDPVTPSSWVNSTAQRKGILGDRGTAIAVLYRKSLPRLEYKPDPLLAPHLRRHLPLLKNPEARAGPDPIRTGL